MRAMERVRDDKCESQTPERKGGLSDLFSFGTITSKMARTVLTMFVRVGKFHCRCTATFAWQIEIEIDTIRPQTISQPGAAKGGRGRSTPLLYLCSHSTG